MDSRPLTTDLVSLFSLAGARVAALRPQGGSVQLPQDLRAGVYLIQTGKGAFTKLAVQR